MRGTLHIPHTEIPFGRGEGFDLVLYPSDVKWLRSLVSGTGQILRELPDMGPQRLGFEKHVQEMLEKVASLSAAPPSVPAKKSSKE
jgi:hypothetical protein